MCNCEHDNNNSGFVFGLFLGAIISALVAIYIYKNKKTDIFEKLRKVLEGYFKETPAPKHKIAVTIPDKVESINIVPVKKKKPAKLFKK